jgi:hypothetical protein
MTDEMIARTIAEQIKVHVRADSVGNVNWSLVRLVIAQALAAQRERDAKIAEEYAGHYPRDMFREPPAGKHGRTVGACSARAIRFACRAIAAAIR